MSRFLLHTLAVGLLGICPHTDAAIITGVTVESVVEGNNFGFGPERLLNGDNMSYNPATTSSTLAPSIDGWLSQKGIADPFPELVLDLGSNYDVDQLILWGWNQDNVQDRTWKDFSIEFSIDNVAYAYGAPTPLLMDLPTGNGLAENANLFDVSGVVGSSNVRYVRFKALTLFGGNPFDNPPIFGMGKVRFEGAASVVPEPKPSAIAVWSVLSGIGLVGGARRQKRNARSKEPG